jgi:hypothetical protein
MADGFAVDRAALAQTAQGISDTISTLDPLGIEETAGVGRGFSELALSGLQAGDAKLAQAFGGFCDRWSWGVRALMQDGSQFARRLGLAAGTYGMVEEQLTSAAKDALDAVAGDPHVTEQQAASASWSQDAAGVTGEETPGGQMTWSQAGQTAQQQWTAVGRRALRKASSPTSVAELLAGLG